MYVQSNIVILHRTIPTYIIILSYNIVQCVMMSQCMYLDVGIKTFTQNVSSVVRQANMYSFNITNSLNGHMTDQNGFMTGRQTFFV
jgi:hypothetical protein